MNFLFAPFGDGKMLGVCCPWPPLRYAHGYLKFAPFRDMPGGNLVEPVAQGYKSVRGTLMVHGITSPKV